MHRVKGFGIVNKADIDVFLELSCFFNDPADVSSVISGLSGFSKSILNIWNCIPECLALGEGSHHCGYVGYDVFCTVLLCILATSS